MKKSSMSYLDKLFLPQKKTINFTIHTYLKDLNSGMFRNKFVMGILEDDVKWQLADYSQSPGSLYLGSMGSGKSISAFFTTLTWMISNSDHSILFIVDPMKGANDYKTLFESDDKGNKLYPQVFPILSSSQQIIKLIDLLYDEAMARKDAFNKVQAESIYQYEKRTGTKMARLVTVMEEFHAIPFTIFDFDRNFKTEGTAANKFHTLMRIGRSYGIWFIACSQKGTKSDIPPEIVPNFLNKQVFRVSRGEANYLLGDGRAAEIKTDQKGRCYTEMGACQYPLLAGDTPERLLKRYMKPFDAHCASLTLTIIKDYIEGRSTKDQYKLKKLEDLVKGIESNDAELIVTLLHEKQGQRVEPLDSKLDQFGISHIIHWNNDIKVAVLLRCQTNARKITGKHLQNIKRAMDLNECTHGIIYTSMNDLPNSLYKIANQLNIEVVDHEDMVRLAYKVDLEGDKANLSPDQLASASKESGDYQIEHGKGKKSNGDFGAADFDESEFKSGVFIDEEIVDLDMAEQVKETVKEEKLQEKVKSIGKLLDLDDEEEDVVVEEVPPAPPAKKVVSAKTEEQLAGIPEDLEFNEDMDQLLIEEPKAMEAHVIKPLVPKEAPSVINPISGEIHLSKATNLLVKREKVTKVTTLRSDDTPLLLFHALRTEAGEVFRVLFYTLDATHTQLKHKFYIDKAIQGQLSFKEKQLLGVTSVEQWNQSKEVMSGDRFDKEFLEYLQNFAHCGFPVQSVCWKQDQDVLKPYLMLSKDFMIMHSTIMEDYGMQFFNTTESRAGMMLKMGIREGKKTMFSPIDTDLEIWKNFN